MKIRENKCIIEFSVYFGKILLTGIRKAGTILIEVVKFCLHGLKTCYLSTVPGQLPDALSGRKWIRVS